MLISIGRHFQTVMMVITMMTTQIFYNKILFQTHYSLLLQLCKEDSPIHFNLKVRTLKNPGPPVLPGMYKPTKT